MQEYFQDDEYFLTHAGDDYDQYMGAIVPPIFMNSLHTFPTVDAYNSVDIHQEQSFVYGRVANPTTRILEKKLALLEHGQAGLAFSSGMAASTSAVLNVCKAGSHMICMNNMYGPLRRFAQEYLCNYGITATFIGTETDELLAAIQPNTQLIYLESPGSLTFEVLDIRAICDIAKKQGITTMIDNSYCTPIFQKPLDLGVDIVMHTSSKYICGHSDAIGGLLAGSKERIQSIMTQERELLGSIPGPMEAWLTMRGLRTLKVRMQAHYKNALEVAHFLEGHARISRVLYPGLASHPQAELIQKQQTGSCGLLSFVVDADLQQTKKFVERLRLCPIGVSWGGFESLVIMPMYKTEEDQLQQLGVPRNLVRMHVGLERTEDLMEDIRQALASL